MLPSGFEPESMPREGIMIGRSTLQEHLVLMVNRPFSQMLMEQEPERVRATGATE